MMKEIEEILFSQEALAKRVREIADEINRDYEGKEPLFVGILKGSFIFMSDLVRNIEVPCTLDFMGLSSYGSKSTTTGAVKVTKDLGRDIEGCDVIIVEDILDSGLTLSYVINYLKLRNPASIKICTLFDKPERRKADVHASYVGFEVPDAFIVGYGLDYAEKYRNLPYIGILKQEYIDK